MDGLRTFQPNRRTPSMSRASMIALFASVSLSACGAEPADEVVTDENPLAAGRSSSPGVIEGMDTFGDGCGASARTAVSPDGQAVTATFSDFVASTGPGTDPGMDRRSCLLQLRVKVPAGWSYALSNADVRGFVALDPGVAGERSSRYVMVGN